MKVNFLKIIFSLCLIFPCLFVFSACGEGDVSPTEIYVQVENPSIEYSNGKIYVDYGETVDFKQSDFSVFLVYSNGDRAKIASDENPYTIEWQYAGQVLQAGTYNLKITYQQFNYNFSVVVVQKTSEKPEVSNLSLTYNGQKQKPTILNADSINWDIITISEAESYDEYGKTDAGSFSLVFSLKDKTKNAWADGSTDNLTFEWEILQKVVSVPTVLNAELNSQTNNYDLTFKFNPQTFVGNTQGLEFSVYSENEILVAGNLASICGNYITTLSLNNQDNINYVWENKQGTEAYSPILFRWQIVPYKFDTPTFENGIMYQDTPYTLDDLLDVAGLTDFYSVMSIEGMTNNVLTDVLLVKATGNEIVFKLPDENENFEWKNSDTKTVSTILIVEPKPIDISLIQISTQGLLGSVSVVESLVNTYSAVYNGASVLDMFAVDIPSSISSIISYDKNLVKCFKDGNMQTTASTTTNVGSYFMYLGFNYDETRYTVNREFSLTIILEKCRLLAGEDFDVPTFDTLYSSNFENQPTLDVLSFDSMSNSQCYCWKSPLTQIALGTNSYTAIYTPSDLENYELVEFDVQLTYKQVLSVVIENSVYTGSQIALDVSQFLPAEAEVVSSAESLIQTEVGTYDVVLKIKDDFVQSFCWIDFSSGQKTFSWQIVKATAVMPDFNKNIYIYIAYPQSYEKTLGDVSLDGLVESGNLSWKNTQQEVQLSTGQDVSYTAIYTPEDTVHYSSVETDLFVYLYVEIVKPSLQNSSLVYTGNQIEAVFNNYDTDVMQLNEEQSSNTSNVDVGTYDYIFKLKQSYYVWADSHTSQDVVLSFEITKREVSTPFVETSDNYTFANGIYTFTYKYDANYVGIPQTLPLWFDSTYSLIDSGSVTETSVGTYNVSISLISTTNCVWNNTEKSTQSFTFSWEIQKAQAISVDAPTLSVVYSSAGSSVMLSSISLEHQYLSWEAPTTYVTLGTKSYNAIYCPDKNNIESYGLTISLTLNQTIKKPTVFSLSTNYTGTSQSISFFADKQFQQWGYNTYMTVKSGSASTTQTDVGSYTYYLAPRTNYVWEDDKSSSNIQFVWSIVGIAFEVYNTAGEKVEYQENLNVQSGYSIKIFNYMNYLVYYKLSETNNLDYNSETETLSDECYSLGTELELEFTISGENPFIYFAYYNGQEVCNLLTVIIGESSE